MIAGRERFNRWMKIEYFSSTGFMKERVTSHFAPYPAAIPTKTPTMNCCPIPTVDLVIIAHASPWSHCSNIHPERGKPRIVTAPAMNNCFLISLCQNPNFFPEVSNIGVPWKFFRFVPSPAFVIEEIFRQHAGIRYHAYHST